jgi:hypothetical protein
MRAIGFEYYVASPHNSYLPAAALPGSKPPLNNKVCKAWVAYLSSRIIWIRVIGTYRLKMPDEHSPDDLKRRMQRDCRQIGT